jgi:hypothetical protein
MAPLINPSDRTGHFGHPLKGVCPVCPVSGANRGTYISGQMSGLSGLSGPFQESRP